MSPSGKTKALRGYFPPYGRAGLCERALRERAPPRLGPNPLDASYRADKEAGGAPVQAGLLGRDDLAKCLS